MTCGQSVDFGTWQRCARARVAHGRPRTPGSRESCWTARAPTAAAGWWSSTTAPPPPPTCTTPMPSWPPRGSPITSRRRPAPICLGSKPAGRRSCRPATPSIPAAGRPWTPAPCARCGSRRATGWPSSRAASSWPSSRAGPTCPGGCPGTAGTSWARARSAGRSMTPWRAWARGPTGRRRSGAGASATTPGRASSGRCWATSWPGSGPARGTGTSAAGSCRRWGCPSARPPTSAPTRCCPRSG